MRAEFDELAGNYDELLKDPLREAFAPGSAFFVTRKLEVMRAFGRRQGKKISEATWLDVGCGKGDLLRAGRPYFGRTLGCDVSAGMIRECGDLDVALQREPDRLPFGDQSVDWVTAVCIYHHVPAGERAALTTEVRRVLRPDGIFAIIEHNPLNPAVQLIVRRTPVDAHADLLAAGRVCKMMREAGFHVIDTRYFLCVPERLYRTVGAVERALERVPLGGQYAVFGTA